MQGSQKEGAGLGGASSSKRHESKEGRPPRFLPLLISLAARLAFSRLPFPSFPD